MRNHTDPIEAAVDEAGRFMILTSLLTEYYAQVHQLNISGWSAKRFKTHLSEWTPGDKRAFYGWVARYRKRLWEQSMREFGMPPLP